MKLTFFSYGKLSYGEKSAHVLRTFQTNIKYPKNKNYQNKTQLEQPTVEKNCSESDLF